MTRTALSQLSDDQDSFWVNLRNIVTALSQAERNPRQGVKMNDVQGSTESRWMMSGAALSQDEWCPGQYWVKLIDIRDRVSRWIMSRTALSQDKLCPGQHWVNLIDVWKNGFHDSVYSFWFMSGTALSQAQQCPGQRWAKLNDVRDSAESSLAQSWGQLRQSRIYAGFSKAGRELTQTVLSQRKMQTTLQKSQNCLAKPTCTYFFYNFQGGSQEPILLFVVWFVLCLPSQHLTNTAQSPLSFTNIFEKLKLFAKLFIRDIGGFDAWNKKKCKRSRETVTSNRLSALLNLNSLQYR